VIIGDGACGKTSLLSVFTLGYFPTVSIMLELFPPMSFYLDSVLIIETALCEYFLLFRNVSSSTYHRPLRLNPILLCMSLIRLGAYGIRELCHRLQGGWAISAIGIMGYGWTRRLRTTTAFGIFQSTRATDRFRR
jgi:GTPase SAR1 family protein